MLAKYFQFDAHGTNAKTELLAGLTTFLTMAYIIFVNPAILADAGMDRGAVFVATCLAAAIGTAIMGLYANYPLALAPGMGLNAYFTFGVVKGMGHSWQVALGAVFISGILFLIVSVTPLRAWVIERIPRSLKLAIGAGIGLFLGIIALQNAGLIQSHPATMVTLGNLKSPTLILAVLGFLLMVALDVRKVPGAIIIAILAVAVAGMALGYSKFGGVVSAPPSLMPTLFQMDLKGALEVGLVTIVFTFFFVDVFDNTGTLLAVGQRAGMVRPDGSMPGLRKALVADSAALGTSTTTSYIESASGVKAGGRTGLTAVTVAILFLLALFFAPLAGSIPAYATAPALLYVACIMMAPLKDLDFEDATEFVPAIVTVIAMPLTFSIAHGIAFGFISYAAIKLLAGRARDVNVAVAALAILFVVKFAWV